LLTRFQKLFPMSRICHCSSRFQLNGVVPISEQSLSSVFPVEKGGLFANIDARVASAFSLLRGRLLLLGGPVRFTIGAAVVGTPFRGQRQNCAEMTVASVVRLRRCLCSVDGFPSLPSLEVLYNPHRAKSVHRDNCLLPLLRAGTWWTTRHSVCGQREGLTGSSRLFLGRIVDPTRERFVALLRDVWRFAIRPEGTGPSVSFVVAPIS